jgi:hypothetical protein
MSEAIATRTTDKKIVLLKNFPMKSSGWLSDATGKPYLRTCRAYWRLYQFKFSQTWAENI